jgi:myo-inositol-1(or 4)-monophosphatase
MDATPIDLRPATCAAIEAVRGALRLAAESAGSADVHAKAGRDVVTSADVAAELVIRRVLTEATGLPVAGEEHGGKIPADGSACWLVDPICGTRNYASGVPLYAVNVALAARGTVVAAVAGDASTQLVHVAERGRGAWALPQAGRDGSMIKLVAGEDSRTVVVEDGKASGERRRHAAAFTGALLRADKWDFRSFGSTLSLAYLASGRVSGYVAFWTDSAVHAAAGSLLVTEAGGTVSDIAGAPWRLDSDSILAAAKAPLHAELLSMITAAHASS